ncbi:Uncharacterised protein [Tyzzerella nexilis]|uniref:Uncharacterized protein n=1 Tax=[Clostridium] nexile TaxID=29361 RepID=A0A6N2VRK2_9FIRM
MSKFQSGFVSKIEEKKIFEEKQNDLKEKYNIDAQDVIIVEKNHVVKFFVKVMISFIKTVATISILVLAAIGLLTVVYPEVRNPFVELLVSFQEQIVSYF